MIYPKKEFGEIGLKGGLHNLQQVLKIKYLYPTEKFPDAKAVIEIIVPDNIKAVSIDKEELKIIPEIIKKLAPIVDKLESTEDRQIIVDQMEFNKKLFEKAKETKKPAFCVKSFRFKLGDHTKIRELITRLSKIYGYVFYKVQNEIVQESRELQLSESMKLMSGGIARRCRQEVY